MKEPKWHKKAIKLAKTTTLSWREISRQVEKDHSDVATFLKKNKLPNLGLKAVAKKKKILLFDIETAPMTHFNWGRWDQNVFQDQVIEESYMLTWAAKWLDSDTVISDANWNYPKYKKDKRCDKAICKSLWKILNEADIIIGHNGDKFDKAVSYTRFLFHGLTPPHPSKSVDTLKIAKRSFRFPSNKLADLAIYLGLSKKLDTGGFNLWKKCLDGDKASQKTMELYNQQDVYVLQDLYLKLRPWDNQHPNVTANPDETERCVACGSNKLVNLKKLTYTGTGAYDTLRCRECGKINRRKKSMIGKEAKILRNAGK